MSKKVNNKGFTLIEVVLVIAIGALIFLLAFIAFGNAQTNRKDSQRRTALDTMAAEVQNYISDTNGAVPANLAALTPYISSLKGPDDVAYTTVVSGKAGFITYTKGASGLKACDPSVPLEDAKDFKITMKLEKGTACRDSKS